MTNLRLIQSVALGLVIGIEAMAQTSAAQPSGYPTIPVSLPDSAEIELARSAAPAVISADASVHVLRNGKVIEVRRGKNGCMISAPGLSPESLGLPASADVTAFSVGTEPNGRPELIVKVTHWSDGTAARPTGK